MSIVIVDGIEIDTTNWIDANVARFKKENDHLGERRKLLSKEIATRKVDLQNFDPRDAHGQAHLKAYIQKLERLDKELAHEWEQKVKGVTGNQD
jgi:hypothetical protein